MTDKRTTELDDAIERVLAQYIPDAMWRIQAAGRVCSLVAAAGCDVFSQVPEPDDAPVALSLRREMTPEDVEAFKARFIEAQKTGVPEWIDPPKVSRRERRRRLGLRWWQKEAK